MVVSILDETGLYNIMSSANRDILLPSERGTEVIEVILSMYWKMRSGPKTEPYRPPEITVVDSDTDPLTTTC